jgi:NADH-quinone oxidoreductase subunit A
MSGTADSASTLWPLGVYCLAAAMLVAFITALSAMLGQRHREKDTGEPYESGIAATGSASLRFHAGFYLIAMFFVIFDLEAVFIYAYAVAFRELGWAGYIEVLVFVSVLVAALFYLWRVGALEWRAPNQRKHAGS